jgi:hypothetical protein
VLRADKKPVTQSYTVISNSFEGVLGVGRKIRGALYFWMFIEFIWPFFEVFCRGA